MRHVCILITIIALTSCKSAGKSLGKGLSEGIGQAIGTTLVDTIAKSNQQQNQPPKEDSLQNQPPKENFPQNQSLKDDLLQIASEMNKEMPMRIDKETMLMNVVADNNSLIYNYMLVNYSSREVNSNDFISTVGKTAPNSLCSNPYTKALLDEGGSYHFWYQGNDRVFIGEIVISKFDCA